jgi:predicted enzyme related to lactoylglutathione lyase
MAIMTEYAHGQFSWIDLMARDMVAACEFYGKLLGWKHVPMETHGGPPYHQFELDGQSVGGIGQMSAEMKSHGIPPTWNSYVNVDDIETVVAKAKELGATVTVPVTKVTDAGWLAYVQDPAGATIAFWQKNQNIGAQLLNAPGALCWNELSTNDIEKARSFYGSLLGWEFVDNPHSPTKYYLIKNQGKDNGGLMQMDEQFGDSPPHWMIYLSVTDADATASKTTQLGGHVYVPPFDTIVGRLAVLADPQGATFSVITLLEPDE